MGKKKKPAIYRCFACGADDTEDSALDASGRGTDVQTIKREGPRGGLRLKTVRVQYKCSACGGINLTGPAAARLRAGWTRKNRVKYQW